MKQDYLALLSISVLLRKIVNEISSFRHSLPDFINELISVVLVLQKLIKMAANRQTKPLADLAVNPPIGLICYRPHHHLYLLLLLLSSKADTHFTRDTELIVKQIKLYVILLTSLFYCDEIEHIMS